VPWAVLKEVKKIGIKKLSELVIVLGFPLVRLIPKE
jgi:hypothetical protein